VVELRRWFLGAGCSYFSTLVKTTAARTKLAKAMYAFVTKYNADGIDLDWEYPGSQGIGCNKISTADSANLLLFLKELRTVFGTTQLITAAVATSTFTGANGSPLKDVSAYADYLSYINLMTYDLVGTWDTYSSSASPLRTCGSDASATSAVAAWTAAGFPASKILLGIPAYATSFTTKSSTLATTTIDGYKTKIRQKISKTIPKGDSSDSKASGTDVCGVKSSGYSGQYLQKELISEGLLSSDELTGKGGYQRVWDTCTQTPFLFSKTKKHFITYEDSKSVAQKVSWARKKGLAGVMLFDTTGFTSAVYKVIEDNLSASVSKRHFNLGSLSHD